MPKEYIIDYLNDHPGENVVYVPFYLIRHRFIYHKDFID